MNSSGVKVPARSSAGSPNPSWTAYGRRRTPMIFVFPVGRTSSGDRDLTGQKQLWLQLPASWIALRFKRVAKVENQLGATIRENSLYGGFGRRIFVLEHPVALDMGRDCRSRFELAILHGEGSKGTNEWRILPLTVLPVKGVLLVKGEQNPVHAAGIFGSAGKAGAHGEVAHARITGQLARTVGQLRRIVVGEA